MKIGLHTPYIHTRFVDLMNCLAARVRLLNKRNKVMYEYMADAMIGMWRAPHVLGQILPRNIGDQPGFLCHRHPSISLQPGGFSSAYFCLAGNPFVWPLRLFHESNFFLGRASLVRLSRPKTRSEHDTTEQKAYNVKRAIISPGPPRPSVVVRKDRTLK